MKKITALLGFVGVVSTFYACSTDTTSAPDFLNEQARVSSSSVSGGTSAPAANSSSSKGSSTDVHDTTVVRDTVVIKQEQEDYKVPYFSDSPVFCWSAECEANWNSTDSKSSSSSAASIEINMSSSEPTPPLISGNQMIDQRDQKSYSIAEIAGRKWMTTNINYQTSSGYYCKTESSEDMCATYGGYYTYAGALRACPDGWRLPTEAEVLALDAAVEHEWWQVGGRFKIVEDKATEYGLANEQGYIWLLLEGENSSFRVKNYGEDSPHELQAGSTGERAYNVRCIMD